MSILDKMNFNPYAFVAPQTKAEYSALLDEALRLMDELGGQIEVLLHIQQQKKNPPKE